MEKRQWLIIGVAILILVVSAGAMALFSGMKEESPQRKIVKPKKYVKTRPVSYSDINTSVVAYGRVQSAQNISLLSEVSGRMYEGSVRLKEGQNFKKGDLLFYIDATEASYNLKSQKSNFLRDLAAILPDLKVDFGDNYFSWSAYFSKIDIEKDLPNLPVVKSDKEKTFLATRGIYSTFYSIKSAEVRLKKYRYYAPFDGSIVEVALQSGAFINPGTRIGEIMRTGVLELKVAVETKDIPWIQMGAPVTVYADETQQEFNGEVIRISDYVNPNTQSVDVYVKLSAGKSKIFDGQFMEASIPARTVEGGMMIPRNVMFNGDQVFVLEDTLLKVKEVNIHRMTRENVIISGLTEGTELVAEPLIGAHNNMVAFKLDEREIRLSSGEDKKADAQSTAEMESESN